MSLPLLSCTSLSKADADNPDGNDEHKLGDGVIGDLLDREFVTLAKLSPEVRKQLRDEYNHRSGNLYIINMSELS